MNPTEPDGVRVNKPSGMAPAWKFLISPPLSGRLNMAVDEYLSSRVESGSEGPVLRVYTWERPCLSLGYFQEADPIVDWEALEEDGAQWVRRQTGGRAVLHVEELTYFASAPMGAFPWCGSREAAYKTLCRAVCHALKRLGVPAELQSGPGKSSRKSGHKSELKAPCFLSPARWEVLLHGKKLVGSAQRRKKHSFFQHGSIPLSTRFTEVTRYLKISESEKRIQEQELARNATHAEFPTGPRSPQDLAAPFAKAVAEFFQTPFNPISFGEKDLPASALPPEPAFLPLGSEKI